MSTTISNPPELATGTQTTPFNLFNIPSSTYNLTTPDPSPAIFHSSTNHQRGIPTPYVHVILHFHSQLPNIPLWPPAPYSIPLHYDNLPTNPILRKATLNALSPLNHLLSSHPFTTQRQLHYRKNVASIAALYCHYDSLYSTRILGLRTTVLHTPNSH